PSLQRSRASSPPALPHLRQNDVALRRLLTPLRRLRAWRRSRMLSLQQPPPPRRQALLARLRLRDPRPLAWSFYYARRALPPCCLLSCPPLHSGLPSCFLCSGLELRHLLPCRICVRTTLLCGAF